MFARCRQSCTNSSWMLIVAAQPEGSRHPPERTQNGQEPCCSPTCSLCLWSRYAGSLFLAGAENQAAWQVSRGQSMYAPNLSAGE